MDFQTYIKEKKGIFINPNLFVTNENEFVFKHQFNEKWNTPMDISIKLKKIKQRKKWIDYKVATINSDFINNSMNKHKLIPFVEKEIVFIESNQENVPLGCLRIKRKTGQEVIDIRILKSLK